MAANPITQIEVLLTKLRDDIEQSYIQKGLVASGNFGRELKLTVSGNNAKITAPRYVGAMEGGRAPGRRHPLSNGGLRTRTAEGLTYRLKRHILSPR